MARLQIVQPTIQRSTGIPFLRYNASFSLLFCFKVLSSMDVKDTPIGPYSCIFGFAQGLLVA